MMINQTIFYVCLLVVCTYGMDSTNYKALMDQPNTIPVGGLLSMDKNNEVDEKPQLIDNMQPQLIDNMQPELIDNMQPQLIDNIQRPRPECGCCLNSCHSRINHNQCLNHKCFRRTFWAGSVICCGTTTALALTAPGCCVLWTTAQKVITSLFGACCCGVFCSPCLWKDVPQLMGPWYPQNNPNEVIDTPLMGPTLPQNNLN